MRCRCLWMVVEHVLKVVKVISEMSLSVDSRWTCGKGGEGDQ